MKKHNFIQISIIVLSTLILIAATYFAFNYSAAQIAKTDLLQIGSISDQVEQIAVPVSYETRIAKGNSFFAAENYTQAASEYAFAINIQSENPEGYAKLGEAYLALNENEKAVEQFKRAVEIATSNPQYKAKYAIALMRTNRLDEAKNVLSAATVTQETLFYSAIAEIISENFDEAKTKFEAAAIAQGEIPAETIQNFINAFSNYDSQKEGQKIYLKALIAKALIDAQEYALTANLAKSILDEQSDYRDVWILLGYADLKTNQYQAAEDAFKQAKKIDPVKPETHYFLGSAHYFQGEYEDAVKEFELALLYNFEPASECYRKIAESNLVLQNYDAAMEAYEYLLKIDHYSVDSFIKPVWVAITYLHDLDRAATMAQNAVSYFPDEAMSYNLIGWVEVEKDEFDKAENSLSQALRLDPDLAAAHYNKGLLREKQNRTEEAKEEFLSAYKLAGEDSIGTMAAQKYNSIITNEITQTAQ